MEIRRLYTVSDEIVREGDRAVGRPVKRVGVAAVIANPLAGQYGADLDDLIAYGEELGGILTRQAVELLGGEAGESFGKAAIVGLRGELEHAAALLHPKFGAPMRAALGGGAAIIPSAKKMGGPGDAIEVRVPAAPRDDEIVVIAAVSCGGRPFARVGGLRMEEAGGQDGLR